MLNLSLIDYNKLDFDKNTLFFGDNLDFLTDKSTPAEFVDLIYLDPPFNSKADYNVLFKEITGKDSTAQIQSFTDFWIWNDEARHSYEYLLAEPKTSDLISAFTKFLGHNNMLAYLCMMGSRLVNLQKVLKPTGSIFLHCDTTASHYLKLLMDSIFGVRNFRNEIAWKRTSAHSGGEVRGFGRVHDIILFYTKSYTDFKFNQQFSQYEDDYVKQRYRFKDEDGRLWAPSDLMAAGVRHGESGKPWHGIDPTSTGNHWKYTIQKLDQMYIAGKIYVTKDGAGKPTYKRYLDEMKGVLLQDIWDDIFPVNPASKERLGFQTQKPVALLERIIKSCTDVGDLVLDPFCGCGTAIIAAERLHRRWLGIDVTFLAINLVNRRLNDMFPGIKFRIEGQPRDLSGAMALANQNRLNFQNWALSLVDARPTGSTLDDPKKSKSGADRGIDGKLAFRSGENGDVEDIIVQVKSGKVDVTHIREFRDVITNNAAMGIFITLEQPTGPMVKLAQETEPYILKSFGTEYPKIQIITIEDLLDRDKRNRLRLPQTLPSFPEARVSKRVPHHTEGKLI